MATLAKLDMTGVLTGFKKCPAESWVAGPRQVPVEDGCDLAPGRYRWDRAGETFVPLAPDGSQDAVAEAPDAIRAIALGFVQISRTIELPEETLAWLEDYTNSFDGIAPFKRPKP